MTKIAIVPISAARGEFVFSAVAGAKHAQGKTAGEALDALNAQFSPDETSTLIIVQSLRPDAYFTAEQQQRLADLMARWRTAQDQKQPFPADEQQELDALIDAELNATAARAAALGR